jgi:hypothetical protein
MVTLRLPVLDQEKVSHSSMPGRRRLIRYCPGEGRTLDT